MRSRRRKDVRAWLEQRPPLAELVSAYPVEWKSVQGDLKRVLAQNDFSAFKQYVDDMAGGGSRSGKDVDAMSAQIRQAMAMAAARRMCISAATGITEGKIKFNFFNGYIAQHLLFHRDLIRKPVSLFWFRLFWPLLWQRNYLMLLVQPRGIYCFYSRPLIKRIADIIGERSAVEIAAGDGTLSRFLRHAGADIIATDDYSWSKTVSFPKDVIRQDASKSLKERSPEVVVCSWPPAGNQFERHVFTTPSVQTYIVISSIHQFGTGNWADYEAQDQFEMRYDPKLSSMVLPPEAEGAVYIFERKPARDSPQR